MKKIVIGIDIPYIYGIKNSNDSKQIIQAALKALKNAPYNVALFDSIQSFIDCINDRHIDTDLFHFFCIECSEEEWEELNNVKLTLVVNK